MRIEICELTVGGVLDPERKVAMVRLGADGVRLDCYDLRREALLKRLFLEEALRFVPAGDGADGLESFPAGSREAIDQVLEDDLYGYNLGGRILEP